MESHSRSRRKLNGMFIGFRKFESASVSIIAIRSMILEYTSSRIIMHLLQMRFASANREVKLSA